MLYGLQAWQLTYIQIFMPTARLRVAPLTPHFSRNVVMVAMVSRTIASISGSL